MQRSVSLDSFHRAELMKCKSDIVCPETLLHLKDFNCVLLVIYVTNKFSTRYNIWLCKINPFTPLF